MSLSSFLPRRNRRSIPEVLQTSAMDCGPAVLSSLLAGIGKAVSYERLRAACQTNVDGTSIDTLEEIAQAHGVAAEQIIVPRDFVGEKGSATLPGIVVTVGAGNITHFIAIWRIRGEKVEVMDPGSGKRWSKITELREELYPHTTIVPAEDWREWAGSAEYQIVLLNKLLRLVRENEARRLLDEANKDASWRGVARLEAAVRFAQGMLEAGALGGRRTGEPLKMIERLLNEGEVVDGAGAGLIPPSFYSVSPVDEDETELAFSGTVLIRVKEDEEAEETEKVAGQEILSSDKEEAKLPPQPGLFAIGRGMFAHLDRSEQWLWGAGVLLAGLSVIAEGLLLGGIVETWRVLEGPLQRTFASLLIIAFFLTALALETGVALMARRLGRRVEGTLRLRLLSSLPRLSVSYVESRPASDLAHRAHLLHQTRGLAQRLSQITVQSARMLLIAGALVWIMPHLLPLVLIIPPILLLLASASLKSLEEREMRERTQSSALSQTYLDALLGHDMIRSHSASSAIQGEHQMRLADWLRSSYSKDRASTGLQAVQMLAGLLLGITVVMLARTMGAVSGDLLLIGYWALSLVGTCQILASLWVQAPSGRSAWLRVQEILEAGEGEKREGEKREGKEREGKEREGKKGEKLQKVVENNEALFPSPIGQGASIEMKNVSLLRGGHQVLREINLSLRSGEHVAVIGSSGAGKSSLISLLLGLYSPTSGDILVDGEPLLEGSKKLAHLRTESAWVDPSVRLWDGSVAGNALFGAESARLLPDALQAASLDSTIGHMPHGLQSAVGEAGRLLSGGEGQRLRFARAWMREGARLALFDEAFRGLDHEMRASLLQEAREHFADATMLFVTHDIKSVLQFSRVLVVERGEIREDGDPRTLSENPESRLAQMLSAEVAARAEIWEAEEWESLRLQGGALLVGDRRDAEEEEGACLR